MDTTASENSGVEQLVSISLDCSLSDHRPPRAFSVVVALHSWQNASLLAGELALSYTRPAADG